VLSNLITVLSAGPAVSLYGSPIISPTTATLCISEPFSPCISTNFFALSHAPPVFAKWYANKIPVTTEPEKTAGIIKTEILPKAEASSIVSSSEDLGDNSDLAHMGLALGGLAILFGAVYGIKKKVDTNSKHILINKDIIKKKFLSPIVDSNPVGIIQTRLAKGEITIDEYDKLKERLEKT